MNSTISNYYFLIFIPLVSVVQTHAQKNDHVFVSTVIPEIVVSGGLSVDSAGNIYASDSRGGEGDPTGKRIYKITPDSIFVTSKLLNGPLGLTIDMQGNLYATNWYDRKIVQITPEKSISILATLPGSEGQPMVHIVFWAGNLYVAGGNTWKVFKVSRDGKVSILAGTEKPGSQDGSPRSASFGFVNGIAVSEPANALIVLDILPNTSRDGPLSVYGRIRAIHFSQ